MTGKAANLTVMQLNITGIVGDYANYICPLVFQTADLSTIQFSNVVSERQWVVGRQFNDFGGDFVRNNTIKITILGDDQLSESSTPPDTNLQV